MEAVKTEYPNITNSIKNVVCYLLNLTADEYHVKQYEAGIAYLEAYFVGDEGTVAYMASRKEFWNWWRNLWYQRDETMLQEVEIKDIALHLRQSFYEKLHNPSLLVCEIAPNRIVYGDIPLTINQLL